MLLSMVIVTPAAKTWHRLSGAVRRPAAWYAGFAVYAAGVALFSGPGLDHWWGAWAAGGYAAAAAIAALCRSRGGQVAALAVAVAGALAAPLSWLATREPITPDAAVVARSGVLLLHHGTPYLPLDQLAHGGWLAYNPYLPVMAVFGLPKAVGLPGILGDPRPCSLRARSCSCMRPSASSPAGARRLPSPRPPSRRRSWRSRSPWASQIRR